MEEELHVKKSEPKDAPIPKSRFRWIYFIGGAGTLLLSLVLICWFVILPLVVKQRLVGALKKLGFNQVTLKVDRVGFGEAQISDIRLGGQDPIAIGKIIARYKLTEAMGGQLRRVGIEGLELKALAENNGVRFPQLENLNLPESGESMDRLPFKEVHIRSAKLLLENPNAASHVIPIEAKLTRIKPQAMAVQISAKEENATLTADVLIGEETVKIYGGTVILKLPELSVLGLNSSLHDVLLRLNFEGEISEDNITLALKPGSNVSAGLKKLSVGEDFEATELNLTGKIAYPLMLESTVDGFKAKGLGGRIQGRVEAETVNWRTMSMQIEARALQAEIIDTKDGLVFALQQGTELDWIPLDEFLISHGVSAKNLKVGLYEINQPAQLHVTTNGLWTVNIPEAKLEIRSGMVRIEKEGNFTCESVNAELDIQADTTAENFSVELLSPARVTTGKIRYEVFQDVPSMVIDTMGWNLSAHERYPVVASMIGEGIKFNGHISTENVKIRQGDWKLSVPSLKTLLELDANGTKLSNLEDTQFKFSPTDKWLNDNRKIEARSLVFVLDKIKTLEFPKRNEGDSWSIVENARLTTKTDSIELFDLNLRINGLEILPVNIEVTFDQSGLDLDLEGDAIIKAKNIRYDRDDQNASIEDSQWVLPNKGDDTLLSLDNNRIIKVNLEETVIGKNINPRWDGQNDLIFPKISIPIKIKNNELQRVDFSTECELIMGLKARVEGNWTKKKQNYTFSMPITNISDKSSLERRFPELGGYDINGTVGLKAQLEVDRNGTKSTADISLKDCSIASSELSAIIEGLSGRVQLNGFSPFTTAESQRITVNSARLGNLELVDGLTVFRLESGGIYIEEEQWSLKQDEGGRFVARDFRLTSDKPIKTDVEVHDLDLGIWLGLLTDGQVIASGKLSGRVPVILNEKSTKLPVRVGDGAFLETKEPGKLQFRSAKWAGDWLESVDPRFRTDPVLMQLRQSVVEALQDFSYSSIRFYYDQKTDNMRVAVRGEGKTLQGRIVKFDPTLNIKPIASWINEAYSDLVILAHLENLVNRDLDNLFGD